MQSQALERFLGRLEGIMEANNLAGGLIHSAYARGMRERNMSYCYVDDRVKGAGRLQKVLAGLLEDYFKAFPDAVRPIYSFRSR